MRINPKLIVQFLLVFNFTAAYAQLPEGFQQQQLVDGLNPVTMAFAPDGRLFLAEKDGRILIVENDTLREQPFVSIEVDTYNERGLSGIALHPDFVQNGYVYVFYTVNGGNFNRISRFRALSNTARPGSEEILLETEALSGTIHNGGAMKFGPDGKLYIATGDGAFPQNANSLNSLLGKILRLNDDGSIPADNPYYGELEGLYQSIWASGFRNPFTIDIHPESGQLLVNDVGSFLFEEISSVEAGKYYGWPDLEGFNNGQNLPDNYRDPLYAYGRDRGCSIVGAAFYQPEQASFPELYHGKYFFADYCQGYIKVLDPESGEVVSTFITGINRPVDIETAPDGSVYYLERAGMGGGSPQDNTASSNGALWKVSYSGSGAPSVSVQPRDLLLSVGETALFSLSATGNAPLQYRWQKDGVDLAGADSSVLLLENVSLADSLSRFRCIISNSQGSDTSRTALLRVTRQERPVPEIILPAEDRLFRAGDTIFFEGRALDAEEGELSAESFRWKIDLHHDEHTHPALEPVSGIREGYYVIPRSGKPEHNIWFRVYLTVTDALGLSRTVYREVFPEKTEVTLNSNVEGLQVNVDGTFYPLPYTFTSVVGVQRFIEAPIAQQYESESYVFQNWTAAEEVVSSGLLSFEVPPTGAVWQVNYEPVPVGEGDGLLGIYRQDTDANGGQQMFTRTDSQVDFNWEFGGPGSGIGGDYFSVVWRGEVLAQFTEEYTFYTATDDGVRLWVDGQLLIDRWVPQAETEWSGSISLEAGTYYPIRMEYFEEAGHAVARLRWSSRRTPKQVIPTTQLYSQGIITGLEDQASEEPFLLYPVPADQALHIRWQQPTSDQLYISILDMHGKALVRVQNAPGLRRNGLSLSVGHLPEGAYVIRVISEGHVSSKLFFKK